MNTKKKKYTFTFHQGNIPLFNFYFIFFFSFDFFSIYSVKIIVENISLRELFSYEYVKYYLYVIIVYREKERKRERTERFQRKLQQNFRVRAILAVNNQDKEIKTFDLKANKLLLANWK